MGECGCGGQLDYKFPGPAGSTYALELYSGCPDCGTPVGVSIHRLRTVKDREYHEHVTELPFIGSVGDGACEFAEPIIEPDTLLSALEEYVGDGIIQEIKDCTADRDLRQVLQNAFHATRKKYARKPTVPPVPQEGGE
jgi:hypothetical protein